MGVTIKVYAAGAAIATVFAQAVRVVCALVILLNRNKVFRITREDLRINSRCRIALQIGLNGVWTARFQWHGQTTGRGKDPGGEYNHRRQEFRVVHKSQTEQ